MTETYMPSATVKWVCADCDNYILRFPEDPEPDKLCPWCMSDAGFTKREGANSD